MPLTNYSWLRGTQTLNWATTQWALIDSLGAGITIRRIRFRWGFYGDTNAMTDLAAIASHLMVFGLVTTVGNGTEIPPDPFTAPNDADPPTQRYLYWEARAPVITAVDSAGGIVAWRDSGSTEETSTRGQVLATGLPAGDSLNLWAVLGSAYDWDPSGSATIWYAYSLLISA